MSSEACYWFQGVTQFEKVALPKPLIFPVVPAVRAVPHKVQEPFGSRAASSHGIIRPVFIILTLLNVPDIIYVVFK